MARTMSVYDDELRITAAITVDETTGTPRCTEIRLTAVDGASITGADLRLVAAFGLAVPGLDLPAALDAGPKSVRRATRSNPAPRQRSAPAPRQRAAKGRRFTGQRPDDDALLGLWTQHRSRAGIGRAIGCAGATVGNWIKDAEGRGVEFPAQS